MIAFLIALCLALFFAAIAALFTLIGLPLIVVPIVFVVVLFGGWFGLLFLQGAHVGDVP